MAASLAAANPRVRLVLNPQNGGFARACNQGLAMAQGDVLVLLNDDTLVPPGWLPRLVAPLADAGGGARRSGHEPDRQRGRGARLLRTWGEMVEFAAARARDHAGEVFDIATVTMFCMAMRATPSRGSARSTSGSRSGCSRTTTTPCAPQAGYRLVCAEDAFVHHFGETSFGSSCPRAPTTSCWRRTSAASRKVGRTLAAVRAPAQPRLPAPHAAHPGDRRRHSAGGRDRAGGEQG